MDAIVTAGGVPTPDEPLYQYTLGKPKAMVDMSGKPMVQWVLDALCESSLVENVVIIGLPEDTEVACHKAQGFIPSQGDMVDNIRTGVYKVMEIHPQSEHVLLVSSDIPSITPEIIDWTVNTAMETDDEAYYNLVPREVMEKRFPGANRSFVRLKDVEVCGGDMNIIRTSMVTQKDEFWKRLVAARKSVFKQAALVGYDTLFLLLLRAITLQGAVDRVCSRLNLRGRAILCPYAEIAMDVDKPHQLELLRADLANRKQN